MIVLSSFNYFSTTFDKTSFSTFSFRRSGFHQRARWMSRPIYTLKMLLPKDQLEFAKSTCKNLQIFGNFIASFDTVNWLLSPIAREAAIQDLTFYLTMQVTAKTAINLYKLLRLHLMHHISTSVVLNS